MAANSPDLLATDVGQLLETLETLFEREEKEVQEDGEGCLGLEVKSAGPSCDRNFRRGQPHLKEKFCGACRPGFGVPGECVRAFPAGLSLSNTTRAGFWATGELAGTMVQFRVFNQHTKRCQGDPLILFKAAPPAEPLPGVSWPPLPKGLLRPNGEVWLRLAYGTLIPIYPWGPSNQALQTHLAGQRTSADVQYSGSKRAVGDEQSFSGLSPSEEVESDAGSDTGSGTTKRVRHQSSTGSSTGSDAHSSSHEAGVDEPGEGRSNDSSGASSPAAAAAPSFSSDASSAGGLLPADASAPPADAPIVVDLGDALGDAYLGGGADLGAAPSEAIRVDASALRGMMHALQCAFDATLRALQPAARPSSALPAPDMPDAPTPGAPPAGNSDVSTAGVPTYGTATAVDSMREALRLHAAIFPGVIRHLGALLEGAHGQHHSQEGSSEDGHTPRASYLPPAPLPPASHWGVPAAPLPPPPYGYGSVPPSPPTTPFAALEEKRGGNPSNRPLGAPVMNPITLTFHDRALELQYLQKAMQEHAGLRAIATNGAISVVFVALLAQRYILEAGPYKGDVDGCDSAINMIVPCAMATAGMLSHVPVGRTRSVRFEHGVVVWVGALNVLAGCIAFVLNVIHRDQSACPPYEANFYDSPAYHEPGLLAVYLAVGITQVAIYVLSFPFALRCVMTLSWRT